MNPELVEEGWLAPAAPGPSRGWIWRSALLALPMLGWVVLLLVAWQPSGQTWDVRISDDGTATAQRAGSSQSDPVELEREVRDQRGVPFVVVSGRLEDAAQDARVRVSPPPGVDADRVAARIAPRSSGGVDVVVSLPASALPGAPATEARPALDDVTKGVDERARAAADDRRLLQRLRERWWWMAPLGLLIGIGLPLLLWRRARRRFFSMRRPGPGKDLDSVPPSSLDPVGAAVLLAGARPVDAGAAFAGHVLDLVERRQLQMRRTTDPDHGAGTLLGLGHADEVDDVAVDALRTAVLDDEISVAVPDDVRRARAVAADARRDWLAHVAARARFERMVDTVDVRRHVTAAGLLGVLAVAALAVAASAPLDGRRALATLVAAIALPAAVITAAWAVDARRWRIVTRARRTERAQWLQWRRVVGTSDGPALDPRSLPVIAATGAVTDGLRATAQPKSVGLDAVTTRTVASLRAMVDSGD